MVVVQDLPDRKLVSRVSKISPLVVYDVVAPK
jgi:hypothetical protein